MRHQSLGWLVPVFYEAFSCIRDSSKKDYSKDKEVGRDSNTRSPLEMVCSKHIVWIRKRIYQKVYPFSNRRDVIRTRDLCVPNAALYQAEPRAVVDLNIKIIMKKSVIVKKKTRTDENL